MIRSGSELSGGGGKSKMSGWGLFPATKSSEHILCGEGRDFCTVRLPCQGNVWVAATKARPRSFWDMKCTNPGHTRACMHVCARAWACSECVDVCGGAGVMSFLYHGRARYAVSCREQCKNLATLGTDSAKKHGFWQALYHSGWNSRQWHKAEQKRMKK